MNGVKLRIRRLVSGRLSLRSRCSPFWFKSALTAALVRSENSAMLAADRSVRATLPRPWFTC